MKKLWLKLLCVLGIHWRAKVEESFVILSIYRRESCPDCGMVAYYVMGLGGMDRLNFVPHPWCEEDDAQG